MATSKIYALPETQQAFAPAAAAVGDVVFEVDLLLTVTGRQSAQLDLGSAARSPLYTWRAFVQFASTPVLGESVDIYFKTSDGTREDNDDGTGDAAVSAEDKLRNLHYAGSIIVDEAVADIEMVASGLVELRDRFVQVVFWNATADSLSTDVNENGLLLLPVPDQGQAT